MTKCEHRSRTLVSLTLASQLAFSGPVAASATAASLPPPGLPNDEATTAHVLNRLTFGASQADIAQVKKLGLNAWIDAQLRPAPEEDKLSPAASAGPGRLRVRRPLHLRFCPGRLIHEEASRPEAGFAFAAPRASTVVAFPSPRGKVLLVLKESQMEDFHHVSFMSEDEKPWKRDLVRTAANRREQVAAQLETDIQAAPSFEEALRLAVDSLKKKFARYTAVSAYVADGEDLAMLTAANRPTGPERVGSGGPLADAARNPRSTMISNITEESAWKAVGLTVGSLLIAPVRTDAGLWAILEVWSDFRDSFTPQDQRLLERVATALGKKTPAA